MNSSAARREILMLASLYYGWVSLSMLKVVYSMESIVVYIMRRIYYG
jgi:hypothetical protein